MSYFKKNDEKNGIEIYFDKKPSEDLRNELKANRWRWYGEKGCWYNKMNSVNEEFAKSITTQSAIDKSSINQKIADLKYKSTGKSIQSDSRAIDNKNNAIENHSNDKGIFSKYEDCLEDRVRLRGVLSDIFLGDKLKVNNILSGYDIGIVDCLKKEKVIDEKCKTKYKKKIINENGLIRESAEFSVSFWFDEFANKYLGKEILCDLFCNDEAWKEEEQTLKNEFINDFDSSEAFNKTVNNKVSSSVYNIIKAREGEKIPKNNIIRFVNEEKKLGIDEMNITMLKKSEHSDYCYIDIIGEMYGKSTYDSYILMLFIAHNEKGEPIGISGKERYKGEDFIDHYSFNTYITIASNELLSDITVRIIKDPIFIKE